MARKKLSKEIEAKVVTACRRRCCLCVFLDDIDEVRPGQIAHLNHDSSDAKFENLVFLCFEHHDAYDSRTSQSKGYLEREVRHWRDKLYERFPKSEAMKSDEFLEPVEASLLSNVSGYADIINDPRNGLSFLAEPWRYPLWIVGNQPEYFAFKARNRVDGVCLIERIDLPDGRIVIVCIQTAGNPGQSITNSVEELAIQVCERFEVPADKLVWLEHYDCFGDGEDWKLVTFERVPPEGFFENPRWTKVTPEIWSDLQLRPMKQLKRAGTQYESKLEKLFHWPNGDIFG